MTGFSLRTCASGALHIKLHFSASPEKDDQWAIKAKKGTPTKEWLREMEMCEEIYDGEPVCSDYRDSLHCMINGPLPIAKGAKYFGGWDCGQTVTPAFTLLQVTAKPWQVHCILEVVSPGAEPMEKFAPRVALALQRRIPASWDEVEHWADATVVQRNGANGETAQQAAKRFGMRLRAASNEWVGRYGAVTWLLMDMIQDELDGPVPRFLIDPIHCPVLREGFIGAYKFEDLPSGETYGPGRVLRERPLKNSYSHVHDSLQYAACRVKKLFKGGIFVPGNEA